MQCSKKQTLLFSWCLRNQHARRFPGTVDSLPALPSQTMCEVDRLIIYFLNLLLSSETESRSGPHITLLSQLTCISCAMTSPVNVLTSVIRVRLAHDPGGWSAGLECDWARQTLHRVTFLMKYQKNGPWLWVSFMPIIRLSKIVVHMVTLDIYFC